MSSTLSSDQRAHGLRHPRALTRREQTILDMLAHGMRNREISEELEITERTVKFHVSSLFTKLGASNRTEAVRLAVQRGLVHM
ncbi:MAG: response regulator transcription factor [Gammaproteobacteria bacterium]|nr:response regulator transcription factor [Gammaproteobacteria bacterium]